ncbi:MAG TPA: glycosyltransferase family 39 protein [Nitrospiria bacterium]
MGDYVTYTDEILSSVVADSISRTGLPYLPSNSLYTRAPFHHYLLSIPIGIFGIDYFSMRLNSILFGLLTIFIIYLLGKEISNPQIAILAALILSVSSLFSQFSLSGRMYITYAAFYTLSMYFFYMGFIKGRVVSKWLAIFFMAATMLSSEAGVLVGPIFAFTFLVYRIPGWWKETPLYVGLVIWGLFFWFVKIYEIPGTYESFTAHSGVGQPILIHAGMPIKEIIGNLIYPWRALDKLLPFSMPFFLIMAVWIIGKGDLRLHYPLVVLLPALIIGSFLTYRVQHRIIVGWVPLYILACSQMIGTLTLWCKKELEGQRLVKSYGVLHKDLASVFINRRYLLLTTLSIFVVMAMGIVVLNKINTSGAFLGYVGQAFGYHDLRVNQNLAPSYHYLSSHVEPNDPIILTTLEYGLFFLGPDYQFFYLRQKKIGGEGEEGFTSFEKPYEPYYGKPLIDTIGKLQQLIDDAESPVWVILDYKSDSYVGPEIISFIEQEFDLVFNDNRENRSKVYKRNTL